MNNTELGIDQHAVDVPDGAIEQLLELLRAFESDQTDANWRALMSVVGREAEHSRDLADIGQQIREATALSDRLRLDVRRVLDKLRPLDIEPLGPGQLTPPTFPWTIQGWLPTGRLTILSGAGGLGKSRLALRLAAAMASGHRDWLTGPPTISRPDLDPSAGEDGVVTVYASWEDDRPEVERRLVAMQYTTAPPHLHFADMSASGPLWAPDQRHGSGHTSTIGTLTDAGRRLREFAERHEATLLVLDPLASAFVGNENDRSLVRLFCGSWDAWARQTGCSVLILSHPPKDATISYSGSTDWRNSARSLWVLERENPQATHSGGKSALKLRLDKSNYGPDGAVVYLDFDIQGAIRQAHPPVWRQTPQPTSQKAGSGDSGQSANPGQPERQADLDFYRRWKEENRDDSI